MHITNVFAPAGARAWCVGRGERGLTEGGVRRMLSLHAAGRLPVVGGNDADE
jgi:hypothetical protein